ncbi:MAG: TonB-dependent receptor, partial [Bacteroidaceae bacterium]|nr:TonB-dependent receptor [Bacteroidaceae bacterium]
TSLKLLVFGGKEKTYHAWNYATQADIDKYGPRYNSCGCRFLDSSGNCNYEGHEGEPHYYDDQTDNYQQLHTQLLLNQTINNRWRLNAALHYTKGAGYYEEYKPGRKLSEYLLTPLTDESGKELKTDLVRRKQMDNYFVGEMANADYRHGRLTLQLGESYNYYNGDHFGNVLWVKNYPYNNLTPNHTFYDNNAWKSDFNTFVKADVRLCHGLSAYADVQYRYVRYRIAGSNDNWDGERGRMQALDVDDRFHFVNPKVGLNWQANDRNRLFVSYAYVSKEPYRNCYTDSHLDEQGRITDYPKPERMHDLELGYQYQTRRLQLGANIYYMRYKDQLVLTGEVNEIGEPLTANMDRSYRLGVELQGAWNATDWLTWTANVTWSRNRVQDFVEVVYDDVTYLQNGQLSIFIRLGSDVKA